MAVPYVEITLGAFGLVQAVTLALIARLGGHTRIIKQEVKNDHSTNLREEQDSRYIEQMNAHAFTNSQIMQINQRDYSTQQSLLHLNNRTDSIGRDLAEHIETESNVILALQENDRHLSTSMKHLEDTIQPSQESQP